MNTEMIGEGNRTGVKTSMELARDMLAGIKEFKPFPMSQAVTARECRQQYIDEAEPLGTVPSILFDKLSERLAFERGGVRLYDALITKCESNLPPDTIELFEKIRFEEADHLSLVEETIVSLGGDPTLQSPCADVVGVSTMGLIQVLNDPRTTVAQCLQAILIAELTDNAGWEMLIPLLEEAQQTQNIELFVQAKSHEEEHLRIVKEILEQLTLMAPSNERLLN